MSNRMPIKKTGTTMRLENMLPSYLMPLSFAATLSALRNSFNLKWTVFHRHAARHPLSARFDFDQPLPLVFETRPSVLSPFRSGPTFRTPGQAGNGFLGHPVEGLLRAQAQRGPDPDFLIALKEFLIRPGRARALDSPVRRSEFQ